MNCYLNTYIMRYRLWQLILYGLRGIYSKTGKTYQHPPLKRIRDADVVADLLFRRIDEGKPLMVSRFGAVEISAVYNYMNIISPTHSAIKFITGEQGEWWWNEGTRYCMKNNAGFFPNDNDSLARFGECMLDDMTQIDILASWLNLEHCMTGRMSGVIPIAFNFLDPFWSKRPWTKALEGKKVLVVHPYQEEIEYQYAHNRERLHKNPDTLPEFHLITFKAVQSIGGNDHYASWFDALEYMEREIDKIDYDVCLLGCGAYGMPLAAHIKRTGKIAVHFGGSLQLLFGIWGKRWENREYGAREGISQYPDLPNAYWIRPYDSSITPSMRKVENGCYF